MTESCSKVRVASGNVANVDLCDCGVLQIHLGPLTLRLTDDAVESLASTLRQALVRAQQHHAPMAPALMASSAERGKA